MIRSIGITHPSAIQRGGFGLEPPTRRAWRRLRQDLEAPGDTPPDPQVVSPPPGALLFPTALQVVAYLEDPLCKQGLAVDIENPGDVLVMVGFCRLADLHTLVVWFHHRDGALWWEDHREHLLVRCAVQVALADPTIPKWMHNGQAHDVVYLNKYGFKVEGYVGDTLLMQRHHMPEQPAGLQWCALNYIPGAHPWKFWVKWDDDDSEEAESAGK